MTQKIYIVEGRQFRTEADYQNALKDQQVIENLRMQTKKMNLSDQKKLLEVIRSGKCRFHSILGQDYMEELAEEIHRQERKDAPVSRANATKKKEPLKKPVKKKETPKHRKAAQKQKKTQFDEQELDKIVKEELKKQEKRRLSVRTRVSLFLLLVAIPLTIAVGFYVMDVAAVGTVFEKIFGPRKYYFISLVIIIYSLLPFFMVFEGRKPQVRELVVLATMVALATAGRAAFFMIPSFKPIIAIVIISAIAFGGEAGFLVGAMTMVVSNFLFGQGPWTPWQMFAMGFIGFLSGILYRIGLLPTKRLSLCIYGFLVTVFIYGGIMNPAALFMSVYDFTWEGLLAIYISGIPVDLVHASSTFIFLWIGAKPLLEKLQRIKIKYDLMR